MKNKTLIELNAHTKNNSGKHQSIECLCVCQSNCIWIHGYATLDCWWTFKLYARLYLYMYVIQNILAITIKQNTSGKMRKKNNIIIIQYPPFCNFSFILSISFPLCVSIVLRSNSCKRKYFCKRNIWNQQLFVTRIIVLEQRSIWFCVF